ncbi:MAG: enoyl-CoA hydratase-related protein [Azospirillaceae bacterium]
MSRDGDAAILLERDGAVQTLTLNRPESRNALTGGLKEELRDRLHEVERDDEIRAVVIRGAGKSFMAGGDVKFFDKLKHEPPEIIRRTFLQRIHDLHPILFAIRRMPKPVIASVHHAAAGFGTSLVAACDMAIASDDAFFVMSYIHLGVSPDGGGSFFLPRAVGARRAFEMAALGERWDAARAAEAGLINRVVPVADLEAETRRLAHRLASGPTRAYASLKRLMDAAPSAQLAAQMQAEAEAFAECATTEDFKEGVGAFNDRRTPVFKGR